MQDEERLWNDAVEACGGDYAKVFARIKHEPWVRSFLHREVEEWSKLYAATGKEEGEAIFPLTEDELPSDMLQDMRRIFRDEELMMLRSFDETVPPPEDGEVPWDIDSWPYVWFFVERKDLPDPDAAWAYIKAKNFQLNEEDEKPTLVELVDMADDEDALAYRLVTRRWGKKMWFKLIRSHWKDLEQFRNPKPPPLEFFEDDDALDRRREAAAKQTAIEVAAGIYNGDVENMFFKYEDDRPTFLEDYGGRDIAEAVNKLGYDLDELYAFYEENGDDGIILPEYHNIRSMGDGKEEDGDNRIRYPWGVNMWISKSWNDPDVVPWEEYFYTKKQFCVAVKSMTAPLILRKDMDHLSKDDLTGYLRCTGREYKIPTRRPIPLAAECEGNQITIFTPDSPRYPWIRFLHSISITNTRYAHIGLRTKGTSSYLKYMWGTSTVKALYGNDPALLVDDFVTFRDELSEPRGTESELELVEMLQGAKRGRRA